jgi:hypothetical protein
MEADWLHPPEKSRAPNEANGHDVGRVKPASISRRTKLDGLHPSYNSSAPNEANRLL